MNSENFSLENILFQNVYQPSVGQKYEYVLNWMFLTDQTSQYLCHFRKKIIVQQQRVQIFPVYNENLIEVKNVLYLMSLHKLHESIVGWLWLGKIRNFNSLLNSLEATRLKYFPRWRPYRFYQKKVFQMPISLFIAFFAFAGTRI